MNPAENAQPVLHVWLAPDGLETTQVAAGRAPVGRHPRTGRRRHLVPIHLGSRFTGFR